MARNFEHRNAAARTTLLAMTGLALAACDAPTITKINPPSGMTGRKVKISGNHMERDKVQNVWFNGTWAEPKPEPPTGGTDWWVNVPPMATTGRVKVETSEGTVTSDFDFTVLDGPAFDEVEGNDDQDQAMSQGEVPPNSLIRGEVQRGPDNQDVFMLHDGNETKGSRPWARTYQVEVRNLSGQQPLEAWIGAGMSEPVRISVPTTGARRGYGWLTVVSGKRVYVGVRAVGETGPKIRHHVLVGRTDLQDQDEDKLDGGKNEDRDVASVRTFLAENNDATKPVRDKNGNLLDWDGDIVQEEAKAAFEPTPPQDFVVDDAWLTPAWNTISVTPGPDETHLRGPRSIGLTDVYAIENARRGDQYWFRLNFHSVLDVGFDHEVRVRLFAEGNPTNIGQLVSAHAEQPVIFGHLDVPKSGPAGSIEKVTLFVEVGVNSSFGQDAGGKNELAPLRALAPYTLLITRNPWLHPKETQKGF